MNIEKNINKYIELKDNLFDFLYKMQGKNNKGFFKYSLSGDLYNEKRHWGLGNTVFAVSLFEMTDNIHRLNEKDVDQIINFILSFRVKGNYLSDKLISKNRLFYFFFKRDFRGINRKKIIIAETKQAIMALKRLNKYSKRNIFKEFQINFDEIPIKKDELLKYLNNLDFRYPWGAGSNFNKLIFFYSLYKTYYPEMSSIINENIQITLDWLMKYYNYNDGSWNKNSEEIKVFQKINGAMKVLVGLNYLDKLELVKAPERLIDLCLSLENFNNACNLTNVLYVLRHLVELTSKSYRFNDIEKFCNKWLIIADKHFYPKYHAFSFFEGRANDNYYGIKITKGLNEPDIHGTLMLTWGLALINKILNLNLGLKEL